MTTIKKLFAKSFFIDVKKIYEILAKDSAKIYHCKTAKCCRKSKCIN
jgi:hypothetical protein